MSYEDSFEREAEDERDYNRLERDYIFNNMRPPNIGIWEWRLMFDNLVNHYELGDAMRDSKAMAIELQRSTIVWNSTFYNSQPDDYWDGRPIKGNRYQNQCWHFIKLLVIHEKFPAKEIIGNNYGASRHYSSEIVDRNNRFKEEYSKLSDSEKIEFDRGSCLRPFPEDFWASEVYQVAYDAIASIKMTDAKVK